jgi:hypothetical protein
MAKYSPPSDLDDATPTSTRGKLPTPRIGDVVRYYDVDGGKADGEVLVGKISLIQSIISASTSSPSSSSSSSDDGTNRWLVEIAEMEDVGDGYYAEYPYRKRPRPALRKLEYIAPLPASYVRSEDAYKVPLDGKKGGGGSGTGVPLPSHPGYDVAGYEGPAAIIVNENVVKTDGEAYDQIKFALLRDAAFAGLAGVAFVGLSSGLEYAAIYAAGAAAGVGYLYLLGVKTDTLGVRPDERLGSNASNVRFLLPIAVLGAVALKNAASGDGFGGVASPGMFSTVSPGQFGSAMIGFLTYRVPLFARQLFPVLSESIVDIMPGSAAMAVRMVSDAKKKEGASESDPPPPSLSSSSSRDDNLVTILLISGPEGTGKTTLVDRLLDEDDRFVRPTRVDRVSEGAKFERLESRGEFLDVDRSGRYGLSREGILGAAAAGGVSNNNGGAAGTTPSSSSSKKVVVVDADVCLARKLVDLSGARLVGVWIGLDDIDKFESLLRGKIASGKIDVPEGETDDAVLRAKVRQVVKDIEFGVVSG